MLQVLDDSTDRATRDLVDDKCLEWRERGLNVTCERRTNRQGYKAGALKEVRFKTAPPYKLTRQLQKPAHAAAKRYLDNLQGLEKLTDYDYVAIFDADFKPEPDFLVSSCKPQLPLTPPAFAHFKVLTSKNVQTLTVPYLIDNPEVGYVQARWVFANPDESYLTKVGFGLEISIHYPSS